MRWPSTPHQPLLVAATEPALDAPQRPIGASGQRLDRPPHHRDQRLRRGFGPLLAPYGESEAVGDVWEPASAAHWLGTDTLGRDLLSRMLYGAQPSIAISLAITLLSFMIGVALGFLAAAVGGWADQLLSRLVDLIMAFPTLILALLVLSVLGSSMPVLIAAIALLDSTRVFRLARALATDLAVSTLSRPQGSAARACPGS